jgi:hypothetical protein
MNDPTGAEGESMIGKSAGSMMSGSEEKWRKSMVSDAKPANGRDIPDPGRDSNGNLNPMLVHVCHVLE